MTSEEVFYFFLLKYVSGFHLLFTIKFKLLAKVRQQFHMHHSYFFFFFQANILDLFFKNVF